MRDHEEGMRVYVQLAVISRQKRQQLIGDRFLLLAGAEACRAGWLDVAARCHQEIVAANPGHLANRFPSFPDALRNEEFQQLVTHWERYCPFEKAEAMLQELNLPAPEQTETPLGQQMLTLLDQ